MHILNLFKEKLWHRADMYCRDCGADLGYRAYQTTLADQEYWKPDGACKNPECALYHLGQTGEPEPPKQVRKKVK